jgi:kynureninase
MTDFTHTRALFELPQGMIYLDGNSLGPLPKAAKARLSDMLTEEWGRELIKGWNSAGWFMQPRRVGDRVAKLIGATDGTVVMGDTLSIKVHQALASALELNPRPQGGAVRQRQFPFRSLYRPRAAQIAR